MQQPAAAQGPKKRPASAMDAVPTMQTVGGTSTTYNGGKIYVSFPQNAFRIIRDSNKGSTEVRVKWAGNKPDEEAWTKALKAIDDFWAKKS